VDSKLHVFAELLIELVLVFLVLCDFGEHLQTLLDQVLFDDLEDFVLLQVLPRDVQGEVLGVNHALDEVEPLGDEVLTVVHDENAADLQLDVAALLFGLEQVERGSLRHEKQGLELQLAFH